MQMILPYMDDKRAVNKKLMTNACFSSFYSLGIVGGKKDMQQTDVDNHKIGYNVMGLLLATGLVNAGSIINEACRSETERPKNTGD